MLLNCLGVDAIRLIAGYLSDNELVRLYGTFDRRLQRLLSSRNAVPRLIISADPTYAPGLLQAFIASLPSVHEVVISTYASLPPSAVSLLSRLKPARLTLGSSSFTLEASQESHSAATAEDLKPNRYMHAQSGFPLLKLLTPTLETLEVQCMVQEVTVPAPSDDLTTLEPLLPNTLTSLALEVCVSTRPFALIETLPPLLTKLELREKTEYPIHSISLGAVFARCPHLHRLSIDGVASVWKPEDDASSPDMLPRCLESLALGAWSLPLGFLRHSSFKRSALVEFELLGCPGAVFNDNGSLEDCREIHLEEDETGIDLHSLAPPSLRILRMRYDSLGSKTASRFTSLPLSITEFSLLGTALSPASFELFRPLTLLRSISITPDLSIAAEWPVTRASWNFEFHANLAISEAFDVTALSPSLTSLKVVAELPQILALAQHLPRAHITCPIPPIWNGALDWLSTNCPQLGSISKLNFANIAKFVRERTLGHVTFTRPWDDMREHNETTNFTTLCRPTLLFPPIVARRFEPSTHLTLKTILPQTKKLSPEQQADFSDVDRLAEGLFRFAFVYFHDVLPKVSNLTISLPKVNIYDLLGRMPSTLTTLDLHLSELPEGAYRQILPPSLTKLSSMKPMVWTYLQEEWEKSFPLQYIDVPFWNLRATPHFLGRLSKNIDIFRAKLSNIEDYNVVPFLSGLSRVSRCNMHLELSYVVTGSLVFHRADSEGRILEEVNNRVMRVETLNYIFHELSVAFKDETAAGTTTLVMLENRRTIKLSFGSSHWTIEPELMIATAHKAMETHFEVRTQVLSTWISLPSRSAGVKRLCIEPDYGGILWTAAPSFIEIDAPSLLKPSKNHHVIDSPGGTPISFNAICPALESNSVHAMFLEKYSVAFPTFLSNWEALETIDFKDVHPSVWPLQWPASVTSLRISSPYRIRYFGSALPANLVTLHMTCGEKLLVPTDAPSLETLAIKLSQLPGTLTSLCLESTFNERIGTLVAKPSSPNSSITQLSLRYPHIELLRTLPKFVEVSNIKLFQVVGFGTLEDGLARVTDTNDQALLRTLALAMPTMRFVADFTS